MKADRFSQQDNSLSFPVSFEETAGPEVEGPTRFARALKRARFARGWTQAKLAAELAIPKRAIVSWETGERIPSVGMVVLLLDALLSGEELSLHQELMTAYIADDLERQEQRRGGPQRGQEDPLLRRVQRVMAGVLHPSTSDRETPARGHQEAMAQADEHELQGSQAKVGNQQELESLFALMAQLRRHPELIPVTRDFLRELASDE